MGSWVSYRPPSAQEIKPNKKKTWLAPEVLPENPIVMHNINTQRENNARRQNAKK